MSMLSHTPIRRRRPTRRTNPSFDDHNHGRQSFFAGLFNTDPSIGSHMPLETDSHWRWNDPINLFPGLVLLFILLAGIML